MPPFQITNALNLPGNGLAVTVADFAAALGGGVIQFDAWPGQETETLKRAQAAAAVHRIPARSVLPGKVLPRSAKIRAEAELGNADGLVAHSFFQSHGIWTRQMARKYGIPYWLVPGGTLDPLVFQKKGAAKRAWMRLYGHAILRDAAGIICSTRREAEKIQERFACPVPQVIHWPVALPDLNDRAACRETLRRQLGLAPDTRILLFLGRLHEVKRVRELVETFLQAGCKQTVLLIAGPDGGELTALKTLAGNTEKIRFLDYVEGEQKQQLLLGSDGYISLSRKENFGYTAAESLAAGLPVILSPGHDLASELEQTDCGWLLHSFSAPEAIAALRAFDQAADQNLAAMGSQARTWAADHLGFERFKTGARTFLSVKT